MFLKDNLRSLSNWLCSKKAMQGAILTDSVPQGQSKKEPFWLCSSKTIPNWLFLKGNPRSLSHWPCSQKVLKEGAFLATFVEQAEITVCQNRFPLQATSV